MIKMMMIRAAILTCMMEMTVSSVCDQPLGLETGDIADDQLLVSSQFTAAVGADHARLGHDQGGGAWCPAGLVSGDTETQEWIQIDLGKVTRVTGVSVQGRWGQGHGQEWTPELAIAWYDLERDLYVQTSDVYPANTDTYSIVKIQLKQPVETSLIRIIPRSQHPRAVCLRLELHGCDVDQQSADVETDGADDIVEIKADYADHEIVDDDRKEISGETLTLTDQKLFPIMLIVLASVTVILIILSVVLLRKISNSRKQIQLPASNDTQYFQNTLHNNYNQHSQQQIKKNIYEVPKVEPIYSTPIEIFYPSSPSTLSTDSSECETLKTQATNTSTPRQQHLSSFDSSNKSQKIQKMEELVTFSPIYSYFSSSVEPKYSNIV